MKTKKIYYILAVVIGFLINSCTTKDEQIGGSSPIQEGGTQAFIYTSTPSSIRYTPDLAQTVDVVFGRYNEKDAAKVNLKVVDKDGKFTVPELSFAAGEKTKTLKIPFNLAIGTKSSITLVIPKEESYWYGKDSITINVSRDYTWLNAGKVSYTSGWAGATKDLSIEKAKEGNGLYRILSPFYFLEPDYCPAPGYHLQFMLDTSYNAVSVISSDIGESATVGDWWLYWDPTNTKYAKYFKFTNVGNTYTIGGLWAYGTVPTALTVKYVASESFVWTEGYPGN